MMLRNGWGTEAWRRVERGRVGLVVSHPFRDDAAEWMGHGSLAAGRERPVGVRGFPPRFVVTQKTEDYLILKLYAMPKEKMG